MEAPLARPSAMALDEERNILYVADTGNGLVRRVTLTNGRIQTLAGNLLDSAQAATSSPQNAADVALGRPTGLALDTSAQELFVLDQELGTVLRVQLDPPNASAPRIRTLDLGPDLARPTHLALHTFAEGQRRLIVADGGQQNTEATTDPIRRPGLWLIDPLGEAEPLALETGLPFRAFQGVLTRETDDGTELLIAADLEESFEDVITGLFAVPGATQFELDCFDGADDEADVFLGPEPDGLVDSADPDCGLPLRVQLLSVPLPAAPPVGEVLASQVRVTGFRRFPITDTGFVSNCASQAPAELTPPTDLPELIIEQLAVGPDGQIVFSDPLTSQVAALEFDELGGAFVRPLLGTSEPEARPFDGSYPLATPIERPQGLWLDSVRNLYVADTTNNRVRSTWVGGLLDAQLPPPRAGFNQVAVSGDAPLTVEFEDASTGAVSSWRWNFGDGRTSSERSPTHVFLEEGVFDVTLRVLGPGGSDTLTAVGLIEVGPSVSSGGFEDQTPGSAPSSPWFVESGSRHLVLPVGGQSADAGMPTAGQQWLEINSDNGLAATPPSNPGSFSSPPFNAAEVSQFLFVPDSLTRLEFDACFILNEAQDNLSFNDFLSVDIFDGFGHFNLLYLDSFSEFETTSKRHGLAATAVVSVSQELSEFGITGQDVTLKLSVGNVGDSVNPSLGYIDNVRLLPSDS